MSIASTQSQIAAWASFEDQWQLIASGVDSKLAALLTTAELKLQRTLVNSIEDSLSELIEELNDIELQIRQFPYNLRSKAQQSIEIYRGELERCTSVITEYVQSLQNNKPLIKSNIKSNINISLSQPELSQTTLHTNTNTNTPNSGSITGLTPNNSTNSSNTAGPGRTDINEWLDQRTSLLNNNQLVADTDLSLDRTSTALLSTTDISLLTTQQLLQQREALIRSRDTLSNSNQYIHQTRLILNRMKNRILTNKLIQFLIIFLESIIIVIIIYLKYFR